MFMWLFLVFTDVSELLSWQVRQLGSWLSLGCQLSVNDFLSLRGLSMFKADEVVCVSCTWCICVSVIVSLHSVLPSTFMN